MATLHAPAPAALAARIAAASARVELTVPPFTSGVTNETPAYKALNAEGEVRGGRREGERRCDPPPPTTVVFCIEGGCALGPTLHSPGRRRLVHALLSIVRSRASSIGMLAREWGRV